MSGWRIGAWDRALARGTIRSGIGELAFDASVADVDEFEIGEEVEVRLSPRGTTYDVERVRPVAWRAPAAPMMRPELGAVMGEVVAAVRDRLVVLQGYDDEVGLVVAIEPQSYRPRRSLAFTGCVLVQMPIEMEPLASVSAFAGDAFARECPELASHWPALTSDLTVFRLEPCAFGETAGYVVARAVSLR